MNKNTIIDFFEDLATKGEYTQEELQALRSRFENVDSICKGYSYLDSLQSIGFLSPDEAKNLQEPPVSLPQDRKTLIACYTLYSKAIDANKAITGDFLSRIHTALQQRDLSGMEDGKTSIYECIGKEETLRLYKEWIDAFIIAIKEVANSFVCTKRRRIREELKKTMLVSIANALSVEEEIDEETGEKIDSTPHLRAMAKEKGYRANAKSLNDTDRNALNECAEYYLNLLEVCYLNGTGSARNEKYETLYDEEGNLKENYYYEDEIDEALFEYEHIYYALDRLYSIALNDERAYNGATISYGDLVKLLNSKYCSPDDLLVGRLLNTKFKEYALNLYTDKQLQEKLSPEALKKWKKFFKEHPQEKPEKEQAPKSRSKNPKNKKQC